MKEKYLEIVQKTLSLLEDKEYKCWENIYEKYAKKILKNIDKYEKIGKTYRLNLSLSVYSSIGRVMEGVSFDIRFAGQSVGGIVLKSNKLTLNVTDKQARYAKDNFGFTDSKPLDYVGWKSKEAERFRSFYNTKKSEYGCNVKSEEHRIENVLLRELSKKSSRNKLLCNIQPVKLGGKFFQLTTPLKGSTHDPEISMRKQGEYYIGATGGGIDILARVKVNRKTMITVFELKDENTKGEPQSVVMQQALIYATFVAKLLRSEVNDLSEPYNNGILWWSILRENYNNRSNLPKHLDINVVTLMPYEANVSNENEDLCEIPIESLNTTLHLYSMYYERDDKGNPKSFSGSFIKYMKGL